MKDNLGDRMKKQYENLTRFFLPRRTYTMIRLDGKAFHSFTKGFERPFDAQFQQLMDETALALCEQIAGAKFAYVQSDEISILVTDFEKNNTEAWFDGNIQKIASISASIATVEFNNKIKEIIKEEKPAREIWASAKFRHKKDPHTYKKALFDSRVFTIPDHIEVENYFIWRQNDATRNSVQMVAQSLYSHKQLHGKNQSQLQDMIHDKGKNWNNFPTRFKRGRAVYKKKPTENSIRAKWMVDVEPPIFTKDRKFLNEHIPKIGEEK